MTPSRKSVNEAKRLLIPRLRSTGEQANRPTLPRRLRASGVGFRSTASHRKSTDRVNSWSARVFCRLGEPICYARIPQPAQRTGSGSRPRGLHHPEGVAIYGGVEQPFHLRASRSGERCFTEVERRCDPLHLEVLQPALEHLQLIGRVDPQVGGIVC
jgi:hypothetical protein